MTKQHGSTDIALFISSFEIVGHREIEGENFVMLEQSDGTKTTLPAKAGSPTPGRAQEGGVYGGSAARLVWSYKQRGGSVAVGLLEALR